MQDAIVRYYKLKAKQKEIEEELESLRTSIIAAYGSPFAETVGKHNVLISQQERREYDADRLFNAVKDLELWRQLSKPDATKIKSLVELKLLTEDLLKGTYDIKLIPVLRISKM